MHQRHSPKKRQRPIEQFGTRKLSSDTRKRPSSVQAKDYTALAKTDVRYWQRVIFQATYNKNGCKRRVGHWSVKIQHAHRRETFSLGTPNRAAAAARARDIYLFLRANGWNETLAKFKPSRRIPKSEIVTVGEFLEAVSAQFGGKRKTIDDYIRAFRRIIAGIFEINGAALKFDYRGGGRQKWLARIHRIRLDEISPARVQKWKVAFIKAAGASPIKVRAARISANSFLRQAKGLFAPERLKFLPASIAALNPFVGVSFEPRQSMRYKSDFDVEDLIKRAQKELPAEQLKIFLLALLAGLRRNEIDKLEWSAFHWDKGIIRIAATHWFQPKSEDALADVEVDSELLEIFRGFKARATGDFVIESDAAAKAGVGYSHYRCEELFAKLTKWLRDNDVDSKTPLHTLRKEFGSQICARHGLYAASHALRHADVTVTAQHYLDKRQRATVGLGKFLAAPSNIVQLQPSVIIRRKRRCAK